MLLIVESWITITLWGERLDDHALKEQETRERDHERRHADERDERALNSR